MLVRKEESLKNIRNARNTDKIKKGTTEANGKHTEVIGPGEFNSFMLY